MNIPSTSTSFSELSTFSDCKRKHFFRYHLRLESKDYSQMRALAIGSMTHDAVETMYTSGKRHKNFQEHAIGEAIAKFKKRFEKPAWKKFFDEQKFMVDSHVAAKLFEVYMDECMTDEPWELIGAEVRFEVDVAGVGIFGFKDQKFDVPQGIYNNKGIQVEPGLYLGELKTRGRTYSTRPETYVKNDLQVKLYLEAMFKAGEDPKGVIHTSLKKPSKDVLTEIDGYANPVNVKGALDTFYHNESKHVIRDVVEVKLDTQELYKNVATQKNEMIAFYHDPAKNFSEAPKFNPRGYPCLFCEFKGLCHDNKSLDDSFSYKQKR